MGSPNLTLLAYTSPPSTSVNFKGEDDTSPSGYAMFFIDSPHSASQGPQDFYMCLNHDICTYSKFDANCWASHQVLYLNPA